MITNDFESLRDYFAQLLNFDGGALWGVTVIPVLYAGAYLFERAVRSRKYLEPEFQSLTRVATYLLATVGSIYVVGLSLGGKSNLEGMGQSGDFFAGLLNPVLTVLTLIGVCLAATYQARLLRQSEQFFISQQLETRIFHLLDARRKILESYSLYANSRQDLSRVTIRELLIEAAQRTKNNLPLEREHIGAQESTTENFLVLLHLIGQLSSTESQQVFMRIWSSEATTHEYDFIRKAAFDDKHLSWEIARRYFSQHS